jgi:hypothetical protein
MKYETLTFGDFQAAFTPIELASVEMQESKLIIEPLQSETIDVIKKSWLAHFSLEMVLLESADFIRAANITEGDVRANFSEIGTKNETYYLTEMLKDNKMNFPY